MYLLGAQWLNEPLRKQILGFLKSFTAWVYRQIIILDIFFCPHCHFVQICSTHCSHWRLAHGFSVIRITEQLLKANTSC